MRRTLNLTIEQKLNGNWLSWQDEHYAAVKTIAEARKITTTSINQLAKLRGIGKIGKGPEALYKLGDIKKMWADRWQKTSKKAA